MALTVLMLHCNGSDESTTVTDSSPSAHPTVVQADAALEVDQKKYGSASLEIPSTNSAGLELDSSLPQADFGFGTADFTIEFWLYPNTVSASKNLLFMLDPGGGTNQAKVWFYFSSDGSLRCFINNADRINSGAGALTAGVWQHVALTRASDVFRVFVNGVEKDEQTYVVNLGASGWGRLGNRSDISTAGLDGYMDDVRIRNGIAEYTGNFAPPTGELPDGDTVLAPSISVVEALIGVLALATADEALTGVFGSQVSDVEARGMTASLKVSLNEAHGPVFSLRTSADEAVLRVVAPPVGPPGFLSPFWFLGVGNPSGPLAGHHDNEAERLNVFAPHTAAVETKPFDGVANSHVSDVEAVGFNEARTLTAEEALIQKIVTQITDDENHGLEVSQTKVTDVEAFLGVKKTKIIDDEAKGSHAVKKISAGESGIFATVQKGTAAEALIKSTATKQTGDEAVLSVGQTQVSPDEMRVYVPSAEQVTGVEAKEEIVVQDGSDVEGVISLIEGHFTAQMGMGGPLWILGIGYGPQVGTTSDVESLASVETTQDSDQESLVGVEQPEDEDNEARGSLAVSHDEPVEAIGFVAGNRASDQESLVEAQKIQESDDESNQGVADPKDQQVEGLGYVLGPTGNPVEAEQTIESDLDSDTEALIQILMTGVEPDEARQLLSVNQEAGVEAGIALVVEVDSEVEAKQGLEVNAETGVEAEISLNQVVDTGDEAQLAVSKTGVSPLEGLQEVSKLVDSVDEALGFIPETHEEPVEELGAVSGLHNEPEEMIGFRLAVSQIQTSGVESSPTRTRKLTREVYFAEQTTIVVLVKPN